MNDEKYLIYVHEFGVSYNKRYEYQFIFSKTKKNIDGDEWDSYPASGNPSPPKDELIVSVGKIKSEIKLTVAQNNEQFSMWDALDGIIPLAWENIDGLEDYPEKRLIFPFGMKLKDVQTLLYEKDITIKYDNKEKYHE